MPGSPPHTERRWSALDTGIALVLAAVGAYVRRDALPTDGLWYDDAWVAVGARTGLADVFTVATNHPGFTVSLQAVNGLAPSRVDVLAWPVWAFGVATAPLLYAVGRRLGASSVVAGAVGALVAVSGPHATYSGRVKPYVVETALIAALAWAVQRLGGRTWSWALGVGWLLGALAVASLGAFGFVAAGLATLVLALHPAGDRAVRTAVLAAQGVVQLVVGARMAGAYDAEQVAEDWETTYDGYIELDDPIGLVAQVGRHLARLGQALVDVPSVVAFAVVALALAGLLARSLRGGERLAARFLLALLVVAFAGSVARQVPFGPIPFDVVFPGARASLWLFPSLAIGLAWGVELVRRRLPDQGRRALVAGVGLAALAVVVARIGDDLAYGTLGTRSATEAIEARRDPATPVFYFAPAVHMVGSEPPVQVEVSPNADSLQGFDALLGTGRVPVPPRPQLTAARVGELVGDSPLVIVHNAFAGFADGGRDELASALEALGYRLEAVERYPVSNEVERWVVETGG